MTARWKQCASLEILRRTVVLLYGRTALATCSEGLHEGRRITGEGKMQRWNERYRAAGEGVVLLVGQCQDTEQLVVVLTSVVEEVD